MGGCGGGMHGDRMEHGHGVFPGVLAHVSHAKRSGEPRGQADATTILKARLARGEITVEERILAS